MTHETEEGAASTLVRFRAFDADVLEVDVLEEEEDGGQQHAGHEQQEGRQELLQGEGVARLVLLLARLARARHPVAAQPLQVTCNRPARPSRRGQRSLGKQQILHRKNPNPSKTHPRN